MSKLKYVKGFIPKIEPFSAMAKDGYIGRNDYESGMRALGLKPALKKERYHVSDFFDSLGMDERCLRTILKEYQSVERGKKRSSENEISINDNSIMLTIHRERGKKLYLNFTCITGVKEMLTERIGDLAEIAHDFRSEAVSMGGFANRLLKNYQDSRTRRYLEIIILSSKTMQEACTDFMEYSKIEKGKKPFEINEFLYKTDIVKPVVEKVSIKATESGITIDLSHSLDKDPVVRVDKKRFDEILFNLLSNGIDYSPEGSSITIGYRDEIIQHRFNCWNKGSFIPEQESEIIFDEFKRGSDASKIKTDGIGLGLWTVKKIC